MIDSPTIAGSFEKEEAPGDYLPSPLAYEMVFLFFFLHQGISISRSSSAGKKDYFKGNLKANLH